MAKNLILWLIIAAVLVTVMNNFSSPSEPQTLNYSDFIQQVKDGKVERVTVDGYVITGKRSDGDTFKTIRPAIQDNGLIGDLVNNNVVVEGKQPEQQSIWTQLLVASFPILVIIAVFMFFMRQMQGGGGGRGGPMSFGKSKARLLSEDQVKTTFADVAGCDEAKEEVSELVEFLRDPGKFQRLGGRIPRGVLMVGPPGTGKSQTIVNMVADAIGRQRSLLIVCQKHAALEGVHKRLVAEGLGQRIVMLNDVNRDREPVIRNIREQLEALFADAGGAQGWERQRERLAARIEALEGELDRYHQSIKIY